MVGADQEWTVAGTATSFGEMGLPGPMVAAWFVTGDEVLAGGALIIGLLTPVVAVLNMINMLVALVLVHGRTVCS